MNKTTLDKQMLTRTISFTVRFYDDLMSCMMMSLSFPDKLLFVYNDAINHDNAFPNKYNNI